MILLVTISFAWILAYVWIMALAEFIHIRRETRLGWVLVGSRMDMRFTVSNVSFLPCYWVQFYDHSNMPEYDPRLTFNINVGDFKQWSMAIPCDRRGIFTFGPAQIDISDPFGLLRLTIQDAGKSSLLVLPKLVDLKKLNFQSVGLDGEGRPRSNLVYQSTSVSSVRDYRAGDSERYIHWPTSARREKLYIRSMEAAPKAAWLILLDLDERHMAGIGWDSIEEQSVSLAASLADWGLNENIPVGLISNGDEWVSLSPRIGESQHWDLLLALAAAKPARFGLRRVLERNFAGEYRHSNLIIITGSTRADWVEDAASLHRRDAVTVFLFEPLSFGGDRSCIPISNLLIQTGISSHIIKKGLLKPIHFGADRGEWKWQRIPSGQPVGGQLLNRFARQEQLGFKK